VSFYGYDGMGNVRQLTNSAGVVTDEYEYDAYGNSFTKSGTTPNNYLYRGEQYDSDLGLYYLRARYYNPNTGRFLSRDPEDGNRFDPASLHKYLYAAGDPVDAFDPTGRDFVEYAVHLYHMTAEAFVFGLNMRDCIIEAFEGETTLLSDAIQGNASETTNMQIAQKLGLCVGDAIKDLARGIPWSFAANHL
jgi:RHS repeat-associated protein